MALLLAALVFATTLIAVVMILLSEEYSPNGSTMNSPMPILVIGVLISGMLLVSHWVHWSW